MPLTIFTLTSGTQFLADMLHSRCHRGYIILEGDKYDWIDWECVSHVRATDDYVYGKHEKLLYNVDKKETELKPKPRISEDGWEEI